jgi:hypothetical protein
MDTRTIVKAAAWAVGAIAFGVALAVIKGQADDARGTFGNVSALWVVLPFLAATRCRTLWASLASALAVTELSLLGFYVAEAAVLDLGPHPWYVDLQLTAGGFNVYQRWGLASGVLYGVLGCAWRTRRSALAAAGVGAAFLAEPILVFVLSREHIWGGNGYFRYPWLWIGEIVLGLLLVVAAVAVTLPRQGGRT